MLAAITTACWLVAAGTAGRCDRAPTELIPRPPVYRTGSVVDDYAPSVTEDVARTPDGQTALTVLPPDPDGVRSVRNGRGETVGTVRRDDWGGGLVFRDNGGRDRLYIEKRK